MGGCSAFNCNNHSRKKHRMFKFPADPVRRRIWTINCRRDGWVPGPNAELCSEHFEENQFEQNRADNWKKLKQTAVPTLFNVPNPPQMIGPMRINGVGRPKPGTLLHARTNDKQDPEKETLKKRIADVEAQNSKLKEQLKMMEDTMNFLIEEQKKVSEVYGHVYKVNRRN